MPFWSFATVMLNLLTGAAAVVLVLADPLFARPDWNKPALVIAMVGVAGLILTRRMRDSMVRARGRP